MPGRRRAANPVGSGPERVGRAASTAGTAQELQFFVLGSSRDNTWPAKLLSRLLTLE